MARLLSIGTLFLLVALSASAWILRGPKPVARPAVAAMCQAAVPPDVPTTPPDMINGAKHPELIPDSIAYRLFFVTVAEPADATAAQKARQRAYLRAAGLPDEEVEPAAEVLASFKLHYDALVGQYNDSVRVANERGAQPDFTTFLSQLNELVESTRKVLEAGMTAEVTTRFESHIQREKGNMRIAKEAQ